MFQQIKKIITVLVSALLTIIYFNPTVNAGALQENITPTKPGISIESINTMRLPVEVKKEFLSQIGQSKAAVIAVQPEEKFTSLNKIAQVMKRKNVIAQKNNEATSLSNMVGEGTLISSPSVVSSTVLNNAELISATPAGVYINGQWSGLSRIYATNELNLVMLDENDYVTAGGRIVMAKEAINESINNAPAVLVTQRSTSGENLIRLTWVTNRKNYILSSNATDLENGKAALLELAREIKD